VIKLPQPHHALRWVCGLILIIPVSGCHLQPNFGPPGTIGEQRARAIVHDPFPDNDLGPEIVSGRPREWNRPSAEPKRLQHDNPYARKSAGPIPAPPMGF
jgi:hypothetical protein